MFGGPNLDTLYVTSIDPVQVPFLPSGQDDGVAGSLFAITGVVANGVAEPRYVL
jgi:sugar lactone lactonase YvrE